MSFEERKTILSDIAICCFDKLTDDQLRKILLVASARLVKTQEWLSWATEEDNIAIAQLNKDVAIVLNDFTHIGFDPGDIILKPHKKCFSNLSDSDVRATENLNILIPKSYNIA
jgi:hypothetical protein